MYIVGIMAAVVAVVVVGVGVGVAVVIVVAANDDILLTRLSKQERMSFLCYHATNYWLSGCCFNICCFCAL